MSIPKIIAMGFATTLVANNSYHLRGTKPRQLQFELNPNNSTPPPSSASSYPMTPWALTSAPTLGPTSIPRDDKSNQTTGNLSENKNKKIKKKENKLGSLFTKENIILIIVILLSLNMLYCISKKFIQNKLFKRFEETVNRETKQRTKKNTQKVAKIQLRLALKFYHGKGTTKNNEQALKWFTKSAELKNSEAQYYAGRMHHGGEGTNKNISKAFQYYKDSAEQGNAKAQYAVGVCYNQGFEETLIYNEELDKHVKDYKKMFKSWEKSADQGHAMAQYRLGQCYLDGKGTTTNPQKAFECFTKLAKKGNAKAQDKLDLMLYHEEIQKKV